jgi:hypothetical protein
MFKKYLATVLSAAIISIGLARAADARPDLKRNAHHSGAMNKKASNSSRAERPFDAAAQIPQTMPPKPAGRDSEAEAPRR